MFLLISGSGLLTNFSHEFPSEICSKDITFCTNNIRSILNDTKFTFAQNKKELNELCL